MKLGHRMETHPDCSWVREKSVVRSYNLCLNYCRIVCSLIMAGAGDGGGEYHQLDESQHLLLDVMTTQMQCLLNHNNEELYK